MKVIISHDVDHLSVTEHYFNDLYVQKLIVRDIVYLLKGKILLNEYLLRINELIKNKISYIEELCSFNLSNQVPATFFLAAVKGRSLSYSNKQLYSAVKLIKKFKNMSCEIHGINGEHIDEIIKEKEIFKKITGIEPKIIRLHYLSNKSNLSNLQKAGYFFDSSLYEISKPYKFDKINEFPIQFMDVFDVPNIKFSKLNFEKIKKQTISKILQCQNMGLDYLVIDFHDRYFSKAYRNYFEWYKFIIEYLKFNKYDFISFDELIGN